MLSAAIAAVVLFDVAWVRAPFLAFVAIPFAVAAWRYRKGHPVSTVALVLWSLLYVAIGLSFAVHNGLHEHEPGEAVKWINAGDFAFAYIGTPIAALIAGGLIGRLVRRRDRTTTVAATA